MKKRLIIISVAVFLITAFIWFKPFYVVPILNYHSVNTAEFNNDTPKVTPEVFARQMEFIHRLGYRVIPLEEYIKQRRSRGDLRNCVVITFDDGYEDNYTYAFPVLKKYRFPATIFIIVKHLDGQRFLKTEQIKDMRKENLSFGSHTISHFYLPTIKEEKVLREEIMASKKNLERKLGSPVDFFCYPLGGYNDRVEDLVRAAGYQAATTTNRGKGKFNRDIYALGRIKITQNNPPGLALWFKLSGYYQLFQKNRNPY